MSELSKILSARCRLKNRRSRRQACRRLKILSNHQSRLDY
jgi:hypothetical protein